MLYTQKSKKTKKYYLFYIDIYGSMVFPTRETLNNKTLEMFCGIDVELPDKRVVRCRTMIEINDLLKLLNNNDETRQQTES